MVLVDQKSRKLIFSGRPKEKEEIVERKRSLMVSQWPDSLVPKNFPIFRFACLERNSWSCIA